MAIRAVILVLLLWSAVGRGSDLPHPFEAEPAQGQQAFASLPMAFEENLGQSLADVRYVARGGAFDAFFTDEGAHIVLGRSDRAHPATLRLLLGERRKGPKPDATKRLPGTVNYLVGDDPSRYVLDAKTFARVIYRSVYPGIDIAFHGTQQDLEYDVIVAPRADPRRISLRFEGCDQMTMTADGKLALRTPAGSFHFDKPYAYQDIHGKRRAVDVRYALLGGERIGFRLGRYDSRYSLVIDPILSISTNLWGTASGVALDASNNIYVVGFTTRSDLLPSAGGYQTQVAGDVDAYVAKLNSNATAAVFTTYLGARRSTTNGLHIAVDSAGSAYVTGTTTSNAFPITPGALQTTGSTFLTKLAPAGNALVYSTFVSSPIAAIAVDGNGNAFVTGTTSQLTPTSGAFQTSRSAPQSPYVAKINVSGTATVYATYVGGSGNDESKGIAVDANGNAYVIGVARSANFPTRNALRPTLSGPTDAFVAKLNPSGSALVYSTYLGGAQDERGFGIAVDGAGQAVAVGWTESNDFPIAGAFQPRIGYYDAASHSVSNAFITKLNAAGNGLVYSTYLGGKWCLTATVNSCLSFFGPDEGIDAATSVALDSAGYAYVGGYATSTEFPLVDSFENNDPNAGDGWHAPLIVKISPAGDRVVYASVLGARVQDGTVSQIASDSKGGAVAVGSTPYTYFPLTGGTLLGASYSFLFKVTTGIYPTVVASSSNPAGSGHPITLTGQVATSASGVLTFKDGTTTLGSAPVNNASASLSVTLSPGIHRITATNSADGKVSPTLFQVVSGQ